MATVCIWFGAAPLVAQVADSARVGVSARLPRELARDTTPRPPVSPRGALLRSLLIPGWGQAALDRGIAGIIFVTAEMVFAALAVKAKRDLDTARRLSSDSVITGYDDASGTPTYAPSPFAERVRPRRQQYEDWIALLVFNHLLAGADAFIGAQLWDVPPKATVRPQAGGATVGARIRW